MLTYLITPDTSQSSSYPMSSKSRGGPRSRFNPHFKLRESRESNPRTHGLAVRYTGIFLKAEENSEKPQLRDRLIKVVRPVITSNGVLTSKLGQWDRTARQEWRKKEVKKEGRKGGKNLWMSHSLYTNIGW